MNLLVFVCAFATVNAFQLSPPTLEGSRVPAPPKSQYPPWPLFLSQKKIDGIRHQCSTRSLSTNGGATATTEATSDSVATGRLLLVLVALLYGTLNVSLRMVYALPDPPAASALSVTRGWLAATCFLPLLDNSQSSPTESTSKHSRPLWQAALELAIWNLGAQGLLNLGLLSTGSARASFLTQTSVVMTPVVSVVAGQKVQSSVWLGCVAALTGLILLSGASAGAAGAAMTINSGDLMVLGGALCWSLYLFRMSGFGDAYPEIQLQGTKTFFLALLYSAWFLISTFSGGLECLWLGWKNPTAWILLFYSALGPGMLADVVQQRGQAQVSASEANVILSLEPVFTAFCAFFLMGEATSTQENVGGALILLSALVASR